MIAALLSFLDYSYLTLLLLLGCNVVMFINRKAGVPSTRFFALALVLVLLTAAADWGDYWYSNLDAFLLPGPELAGVIRIRLICSTAHYILTPVVILLELLVIAPDSARKGWIVLPAVVNGLIYLLSPLFHGLVFWISTRNHFHRGPLGGTIFFVLLFYVLLLLCYSVRMFRDRDTHRGTIVLFIVVMTALTIVLEVKDLVTCKSTAVTALGILLYYNYLLSIHQARTLKTLAEQRVQNEWDKIQMLQLQIHPHFIFNSLHVIKSLIRRDPERAMDALIDFSDYLRSHIDVIRSDRLIPFSSELEHLRAYLALEFADGIRNIQMEYQLEEMEFLIPALAVQPIVENAIRHGLGGKGGIVRLSTCRSGEDYLITVEDNGAGMGASTSQERQWLGVGIENVRTRLRMQCGGSLTYRTGAEGTVAILRIPVKQDKGQDASELWMI